MPHPPLFCLGFLLCWFTAAGAPTDDVVDSPTTEVPGGWPRRVSHSPDASVALDWMASYIGDSVWSVVGEPLISLSKRMDKSEQMMSVPRDCSDLAVGQASGVYLVRPGLHFSVPVYCDMETDGGGWTVFQRRADITPRQDFYLNWDRYRWGFGSLDAEFWWGNEHIWLMTSLLDRQYELRIDMEDFEGEKQYAVYQGFRISSEADGFRLAVSNFSGSAGDALLGHSGYRFSTQDRDHDTNPSSCAVAYKGAWWYSNCHSSNLNGKYLAGEHSSYADGINWSAWRGHHYSMKDVEMKMRPSRKLDVSM